MCDNACFRITIVDGEHSWRSRISRNLIRFATAYRSKIPRTSWRCIFGPFRIAIRDHQRLRGAGGDSVSAPS
jgi:hypothetical protein